MSTQIKKAGKSSGLQEIEAAFEREGLSPHGWGNEPGYRYGWHSHAYHKVLYCVSGASYFTPGMEISSSKRETGWTWSPEQSTQRR